MKKTAKHNKTRHAALPLLGAMAMLLFLGACASQPEPNFTNMPGDFKVTKIQDDLFDIRYTGAAYTSIDQAKGIAAQRVATLCLNEGYNFFVVLEKKSNWVERPGDPSYSPDHSAAQPHKVPVVDGQIRLFKKKPSVETRAVYDAAQVEKNLAFQ